MTVARGSNIFLGRLEIRGPILPRLCWRRLSSPGLVSASCPISLGRERTLPGPCQCQEQGISGCSPLLGATQSLGQPETLRVHARPGAGSGPWSWKKNHPKGTGMPPALCSIAGLHPRRSAARRGKVCKRLFANLLPAGTQCPTPRGCFGRGSPPKPRASPMDQEQALKQHHSYLLPGQRGVERLGAIKQLCKPR